MTIPDYQAVMLPLLQIAGDGEEHGVRVMTNTLAANYELTPEERSQLLPSNRDTVFHNRVGWGMTFLAKVGLLIRPKRGVVTITEEGKRVLATKPSAIDTKYLLQYPEFAEWMKPTTPKHSKEVPVQSDVETPDEVLEASVHKMRQAVADELLIRVLAQPPAFFEQLVCDCSWPWDTAARMRKPPK
jgi:restriction system protein